MASCVLSHGCHHSVKSSAFNLRLPKITLKLEAVGFSERRLHQQNYITSHPKTSVPWCSPSWGIQISRFVNKFRTDFFFGASLPILNLELFSSHVLILERRKLIIHLHLRVVQELYHWLRRKDMDWSSGKNVQNIWSWKTEVARGWRMYNGRTFFKFLSKYY